MTSKPIFNHTLKSKNEFSHSSFEKFFLSSQKVSLLMTNTKVLCSMMHFASSNHRNGSNHRGPTALLGDQSHFSIVTDIVHSTEQRVLLELTWVFVAEELVFYLAGFLWFLSSLSEAF